MNARLSTNRKFKRILTNILSICAILAIALPVTQVAYAVSSSPFVGHWQATDIDGSDIRLAISGPPSGPLQITWTESYISFCNREAGIVRGTGQLNKSDPNLLEANLHLECLKTGATLDFHLAWRYHPATGTLSSRYGNGAVTIWHRPGQPPPPPPALGLRVDYGDNWVESFYEGGHMAWITVTESDGVTVKATAELVTEPKDYWGGETGFHSLDSTWLDANGNPTENPPDIQPNDWVFGWVDNGASAQVQIGEISGTIDLAANSIAGAITAPWFTDRVQVECLDWGSGREQPFGNKDGGLVLTDGADHYSCSWAGEWDIQPGQTIGVGYFGPDGNWVANAFTTPKVRLIAFPAGEQIFGYYWPEGSDVHLAINGTDFTQTATVGPSSWDPNDILALLDFHGQYDLKPGDVVMLSGSGMELTYTVLNLSVSNVDVTADIVTGTADPGASLTVAPFGFGDQALQVTADEDGNWLANFTEAGIDLVEGMCGRSQMYDLVTDNNTAVDWCIPAPRLIAFPAVDEIFGYNWPEGTDVHLTIHDPPDFEQIVTVVPSSWDPNDILAHFSFNGQYDLKPGDVVTLSGSGLERTYTVRNLTVTNVDPVGDTVSGKADPGTEVMVDPFHFGDLPLHVTAGQDGNWLANFAEAGIDLVEGMCGRSEMFDELSNSTAVDWCIP